MRSRDTYCRTRTCTQGRNVIPLTHLHPQRKRATTVVTIDFSFVRLCESLLLSCFVTVLRVEIGNLNRNNFSGMISISRRNRSLFICDNRNPIYFSNKERLSAKLDVPKYFKNLHFDERHANSPRWNNFAIIFFSTKAARLSISLQFESQ